MFSGIIQTTGIIRTFRLQGEKARIEVRAEFRDCELGESIAVNGVCLTVCERGDGYFAADVSTETLNRTIFKRLGVNARVNLERALLPSQRNSGHFVTGHVDGVATVAGIDKKSGEILARIEHPAALAPFIIEKGSIAIDGISLTVFDCSDNRFSIAVIPHTYANTTLRDRQAGDAVNIECDMIGKYIFKACETILRPSQKPGGAVSLDMLRQNGFL